MSAAPGYLRRLSADGQLPHSQLPAAVREELRRLRLVRIETRGRRRTVVVTDPAGMARWVTARFPAPPAADLPPRAANIAAGRSSKRGVTAHAVGPVLLRWFGGGGAADASDHPAALTGRYGLVGVTTATLADLPWPAEYRLLLVENWESFQRAAYPSAEPPVVVVYLSGNPAEVLLAALAQRPPAARVVCFVDYDWAGLRIFGRVHAALPSAELHVPAEIEALFRRYTRYDLVAQGPIDAGWSADDAAAAGASAAGASVDAAVRQIGDLIARHNGGLEQEIVAPPPM